MVRAGGFKKPASAADQTPAVTRESGFLQAVFEAEGDGVCPAIQIIDGYSGNLPLTALLVLQFLQ
jgi:hypothetical protein